MLKIFLIVTLLLTVIKTQNWVPDEEGMPLYYLERMNYMRMDETNPSQNRKMLQDEYESIRIHADFSCNSFSIFFSYKPPLDLPSDDSDTNDYIENQLVASAISYFQATLKVNRLQQNLIVEPECQGYASPQYLVDEGVEADFVLLVKAGYYGNSYTAYTLPCGLLVDNNRFPFTNFLFVKSN